MSKASEIAKSLRLVGLTEVDDAADLIEQQAALILSLESRTAQQARTIAAMCQQVADLQRTVAPAVDAQPVAEAWQPIETAPKDGTEVLLIATRHSMLMPHPERIVGAYRNGWWSGPSTLSHVTHWMPLPEAPAALPQKDPQ